MPAYSADGGFTGSSKGTATKGTSAAGSTRSYNAVTKSAPTRSSAPNAAAAAASSRMASGNLGRSTPSGVGNQMGGGGNSSGFRNTVNAAAANANRLASLNRAQPTQSSFAGKGNFGGTPTMTDRVMAGLGLRSLPTFGGGQASPGVSPGWNAFHGLQKATAAGNPSVNSIVSGAVSMPRVVTAGEIGSLQGAMAQPGSFDSQYAGLALPGLTASRPAKDQSRVPSGTQKDQSRVPQATSGGYDPLSSVNASRPTPVASPAYQNPARAYPARPASAPAYQNPARAFPERPEVMPQAVATRAPRIEDIPPVPMRGQTVNKGINYTPTDMAEAYGQYRSPPAGLSGLPASQTASFDPLSSMAKNSEVARATALEKELGAYAAAEPKSPNPWSQIAGPNRRNVFRNRINDIATWGPKEGVSPAAGADPAATQHPLYEGDSTPTQKIAAALTNRARKIANPLESAGNWLNTKLGGSPYNDLYGNSNQSAQPPHGRDSSSPPKELVAAAQAGDPAAQDALKKWFIWNQWPVGQRPANI